MSTPEFTFPSWMGVSPRLQAPWSPEEEAELVKGWKSGLSIQQLCSKHGRGVGGIESRLSKLIPNFAEEYLGETNKLRDQVEELRKNLDYNAQEFASRQEELKKRIALMEEQLRQRGCRIRPYV